MIIHCPDCNTRYNLTARQIGATGRTLKCASCGNTFFQPPVEDDGSLGNASGAPIAPQTSADSKTNTHSQSSFRIFIPILATLVFTVVIGGGVTIWKMVGSDQKVGEQYSPVTFTGTSDRSEVHSETGLILSEIEREIVQDNKLTLLLFHGKVTNSNTIETPVPEIRVQLLDHRGVELDFWPADLDTKTLQPEETTTWTVRFINPPLERIAKYKAFFRTP